MKRSFGLWTAIAMVVGSMIGAGIFTLPRSLAQFGWTSAAGWVLTALGVLTIGRVIADLTTRHPDEPNILTIAGDSLGLLPGRLIAWSYWVGLIGSASVLSTVAADYIVFLSPDSVSTGGVTPVVAFVILLGIAALNLRGAQSAGKFQVATTILKLVPLLFIIGIVAFLAISSPSTYIESPSEPFDMDLLTPALGGTFFAVLGFEGAAMISQRVRDPKRNVARATLYGLAVVLAIYFIVSTGIVLATPVAELRLSSAPLAAFASTHAGPWSGYGLAIFATISAIGCLNAVILLLGDIPFGMVRDGQLPRWVAPGSQHGVGRRPLLAGTAMTAILVLTSSHSLGAEVLDFLLRLTTASVIFFYAGICAAALRLAIRRRMALLGLGFCAWVLYGTGTEASLLGIGLMVVGAIFHFLIGGRTTLRGSAPANEA